MMMTRNIQWTPIKAQASGMGAVPLLLPILAAGAGAGAVVGTQAVQESYRSGWLDNLAQVFGLKPSPSMSPAPSPASQPPVAPQTAWGMRNWSPAMEGESVAQRWAQFTQDTDWFQRQHSLDMPQSGTGSGSAQSGPGWLAVGMAAAAAVSLIIVIGRRA